MVAHVVSLEAYGILFLLTSFCAQGAEPVGTNGYVLTLRYPTEIKLTEAARENLYTNALRLVRTSNFNSEAPRWDWDMATVREQYRKTMAGSYLRIVFARPQKLKTVEEDLMTREVVIGLNRPDYASALFTLDEHGALVGHSKYDGGMCVRMLDMVKALAESTKHQL